MKILKTRKELKTWAKKNHWILLSEGEGAIAFLLPHGQSVSAYYSQDTDELLKVNDAANAVISLPYRVQEDD